MSNDQPTEVFASVGFVQKESFMRRWIVACLLGVLSLGIPSYCLTQPARDVKKGSWHSSYESARTEARKSGKPLMVVFRCER